MDRSTKMVLPRLRFPGRNPPRVRCSPPAGPRRPKRAGRRQASRRRFLRPHRGPVGYILARPARQGRWPGPGPCAGVRLSSRRPIMNLALLPVLACLPLTVGLAAQTAKDPNSELAVREAAAKDDVSALIKTADWAKEHGLLTEWRRLLQRVLALAPEHEAANQAVGNVKHEGRWM